MKGSFLILWFLFILAGCETFEYHPYDTRLESKYQDLNRKNIEKIFKKHLQNVKRCDIISFAIWVWRSW